MSALQIPGYFNDLIGMGRAERVFPVKRSSKWGSFIATLFFLGGAVALFLFGIWYTYDQVQKHGPAILQSTIIPMIVFEFFLVIVGVIAAWFAFINWKKSAVLYQNGFAYNDRKGVHAMRWDEIDSIRAAITRHYTNGVYTGTTHTYTIEKKDGTRLVINDSISKVEELASAIRENVFPLLYQRYSAAYNTGQPVTFGDLTLSRADGITCGRKSFPWDQVASVSIDKGYIRILKKGGGWFSGSSILASNIPNLEVMLSIVDQIIGVQTKK